MIATPSLPIPGRGGPDLIPKASQPRIIGDPQAASSNENTHAGL